MPTSRFDPTHSVAFHFGRGRIELQAGAAERVLLPAEALVDLWLSADPETRKDFARRLGIEAGKRTRDRLGDPSAVEPEVAIEHLGGEIALMGLGSLGVERWGRALVLTVSHSPFDARADQFTGWLLEGAIQRAFGRDVFVVCLGRERSDEGAREEQGTPSDKGTSEAGHTARFLVTGERAATQARAAIDRGASFGQVLMDLQVSSGRVAS